MKILCVCLSATIQRTIQFYSFEIDNVNRSKNWREDASGKALNAARVLNQLEPGCSTALCPVGNTNAEHFLVLASRDNDLYVHPVYIEGNTRECWTLLDSKNQTTTEVISDEGGDLQHIAGAEAELDLIENIREYIVNYYDGSGYDQDTPEAQAVTFEEIAKVIHADVIRCESLRNSNGRICPFEMMFTEWAQGLPGLLNTCYYYNRSAIDDLGAILEESEAEKAKYNEREAERELSRLLAREIRKAVKA